MTADTFSVVGKGGRRGGGGGGKELSLIAPLAAATKAMSQDGVAGTQNAPESDVDFHKVSGCVYSSNGLRPY